MVWTVDRSSDSAVYIDRQKFGNDTEWILELAKREGVTFRSKPSDLKERLKALCEVKKDRVFVRQ